MRITRVGLVGGALIAGVIGFVVVTSMFLSSATCEVCINYNGRNQCRTVSGTTQQEAMQAAVINACAFISSGVTDSMACQREIPVSHKCY